AVGRAPEALELGRRALSVLEAAGRPEAVRARIGIAYALQQSGQRQEALAAYDDLIAAAGALNDQQALQFAYCNRAELSRGSGDLAEAEEDLRRAIEGLESRRSGEHTLPLERAGFLEAQVAAYDRLILLLADSYRGLEGFEVAERFHARAFLDTLRRRSRGAGRDPSPSLRRRRNGLLEELGAVRLAIEQRKEPPPAGNGTDRLRRRLEELEVEWAQLQLELQGRGGTTAAVSAFQALPRAEVQGSLRPGEALVGYWVSEGRIFAWALSPSQARWIQLPLPREELAATVRTYLEPLLFPRRAEDLALQGKEGQHLEAGRRLYSWLIAPLPRFVHEARTLLLVPDDVLNTLPFEALVKDCRDPRPESSAAIHGVYRSCTFLGLEQELVYNPSAGALEALRRRPRPDGPEGTLLSMSPSLLSSPSSAPAELRSQLDRLANLQYAQAEARSVAQLFDKPRVLLGKEASESRFKAEAAPYRWIHLATHGLVRDDLPMTSGLLLAASGEEDGLLQAYEVLGLELSAEMVTLSACRSGRGRLQRGEGVVGLSQAFLQAGARSVLVSRWDVDDRSTA
ncbi:MAG: CHAT domain-containing protein, partial [Acidobacteria bacterium]|nr:CHAT domain-containing protein [Acidobacteriota bacterium]